MGAVRRLHDPGLVATSRRWIVLPGVRWVAFGLAAFGAVAMPAVARSAATVSPRVGPGFRIVQFADGQKFENSCSTVAAKGVARCFSFVRVDAGTRGTRPSVVSPPKAGGASSTPAATIGDNGAYGPSWLQSAYNAPSATNGSGQTVAIVDAYDDPNAESDLAAYRTFYGLSACTTANGCFTKVNQTGGQSPPVADAGWAQEISLDLDMISALCPRCHILLVEANSNLVSDLGAAAGEAVSLGANIVSNSYGAPEFAGQTAVATSDYEKPGVAMVAATGDKGYGVTFPASDPDVIAVGGTSLYQATNTGTRNATETAWSGAGSGCSAYEPKPSWQLDPGCPQRTVADVSADADPNTGVWVYDSYQSGPWDVVGGTSAAAPIIAGIFALAGPPAPGTIPSSYPYANPGALNDIVSGSNGNCGSYLCTAGPGYDGPTGLGTPNGIAAFSTKHSQTITFNVPTAGQLGGSALLAPTASSGLPVTLTVDPATSNGACTLAGYAVTYAAVGTCVLDANQAGDSTHLAATRVQREIGVSPTGGTMAFADMIGGIYTMADNGLGLQHVPVTGFEPGSAHYIADPVWSPDRKTIAFTSSGQIWTVPSIGGAPTPMATQSGAQLSWSPDGTKIAYSGGGWAGVTIMSANGTTLAQLPYTLGTTAYSPAWSPDGTKIAWILQKGVGPNLWVMNADGTGQTQLTSFNDVTDAPSAVGAGSAVAWSPDGRQIAFVRGLNSAPSSIWVVNADGTGAHVVVPASKNGVLFEPELPVWSPNGLQLLFSNLLGGGTTIGLWTVNADGSGLGEFLPTPDSGYSISQPSWWGPVSPPTPVNSSLPLLTGVAQVGSTLTATGGSWTGSPTAFSIGWLRCDSSGANCTSIGNQTDLTYLLTSADQGATIRAAVTATNSYGSTTARSAPSAVVQAGTMTTPRVTQSIADGSTISGQVPWTATPSAPAWGVSFFIDGVQVDSDGASPYSYGESIGGRLDTGTLSNGTHVFRVDAFLKSGTTISSQVSATVSNSVTAATVTQSIADGSTVSGQLSWTATPSGPAWGISFSIDGVLVDSDGTAPFSYGESIGGHLDTTGIPNGTHVFRVDALLKDGTTVSSQVSATVSN